VENWQSFSRKSPNTQFYRLPSLPSTKAEGRSFLGERVEMRAGMTPSAKSRFEMILSVKEHEMHHRGQLMLIERIVGIVPHLTRQMQARMAEASGKS
jgi:hypothetical protein